MPHHDHWNPDMPEEEKQELDAAWTAGTVCGKCQWWIGEWPGVKIGVCNEPKARGIGCLYAPEDWTCGDFSAGQPEFEFDSEEDHDRIMAEVRARRAARQSGSSP